MIIEAKNVSKKYGKKIALDNFSMELEEGKIMGILGPNGSGKSTFLKILSGLVKSYKGDVLIDGKNIGVETKNIVSYLPDKLFLDREMNVSQAEKYFIDFFEDFNQERFNKLLGLMNLSVDMVVKEMSKGMLEKLNLSLILSRDAKLYLLDEPIGGVDPVARDQIMEAIIETISEDSSMIITTHLVRDMENLFDEILFIKEGSNILQGDKEDLRFENKMNIDQLYRDIFSY